MAMNSKWLLNSIRNFEPYTIPEIKEKTIINANESPYNVLDFPSVREDFFKGLQNLEIFRYPAPMADALRQALAEYVGCRPEQVLATNGGDEILALIIQTFINPGDTVLLHVPTFDVYISNAEIGGAKVVRFDEGPDFVHDAKAYCEEVKRLQPKLTVICNPNNPTGAIWSTEEIKAILDVAENLVVVDEAYIEFSEHESVVSLVDSYDNLIVVRTLSKAFGLAGCRLGYGVTNKGLIEALMLTKLYYNLNSFTQLMGLVVMKHRDEILDHNVPPTVKNRKNLIEGLQKVRGVTAYPSASNFVLVKVPDREKILQALHDADIAVRYYGTPQLSQCVRLSVTTADVVESLITVFQQTFGEE